VEAPSQRKKTALEIAEEYEEHQRQSMLATSISSYTRHILNTINQMPCSKASAAQNHPPTHPINSLMTLPVPQT
jgi:hypothetical protein